MATQSFMTSFRESISAHAKKNPRPKRLSTEEIKSLLRKRYSGATKEKIAA